MGWHLELDERYVRSVLDKSGMGQANSAVTPGSKDAVTTTGSAGKSSWTRKAIETIALG